MSKPTLYAPPSLWLAYVIYKRSLTVGQFSLMGAKKFDLTPIGAKII